MRYFIVEWNTAISFRQNYYYFQLMPPAIFSQEISDRQNIRSVNINCEQPKFICSKNISDKFFVAPPSIQRSNKIWCDLQHVFLSYNLSLITYSLFLLHSVVIIFVLCRELTCVINKLSICVRAVLKYSF